MQQQYAQLVTTYQQIRTEYLLLREQAQRLPVNMTARYRSPAAPWPPFVAASAYGTTTPWIAAVTSGLDAGAGYRGATQDLRNYGVALSVLSADEAARVTGRADRVQLADASIIHGLEAVGLLRKRETSVERAVSGLEDDAYSDDPDFNTQVAVLNKINAAAVSEIRLTKDANQVLVSLLEQHLLEATERREAAVAGLNAHVAFETDARPLLAQTTLQTTQALTTFRIP